MQLAWTIGRFLISHHAYYCETCHKPHSSESLMIVVRRHHDLGLTAAKRLAETIARRLQHDHGGTYTWEGNDLLFQRTGASGRVAVTKNDLEVSVELGFLLSPLSSRIEREIRAVCDEHFGQAEPPDRRPPHANGPAKRRRGPPRAGRREDS